MTPRAADPLVMQPETLIEENQSVSVARHTEITAASSKSFEDAIQQGISRAAKTIRNLRSAWVKDQKVILTEDGKVQEYRVDMKISFVLEDG